MKRILVVAPSLNDAVYNQRVRMFISPLEKRGFAVDTVKYPRFLERRRLFSRLEPYDAIWVVRKRLDPFSAEILRRSPRPMIFDFDDAVMIRSRERRGTFRSRSRERNFFRTLKVADAVLAGSSHLAELARPFNPHVHVVPTGVNVGSYPVKNYAEGPQSPIRLVWIGSASTLRFLVSQRALFRRITEIWPEVCLRIICNRFPDWDDLPIEKVIWSPTIEGVSLSKSDIGISPLPDTPFTRGKCGFKLIQYMAAGLPVVTTPVGAHTEIVKDGLNGLFAEGEDEWLKAVGRLVEDRALRERFGLAGRKRVEERYDVSVLVEDIGSVLAALTAR